MNSFRFYYPTNEVKAVDFKTRPSFSFLSLTLSDLFFLANMTFLIDLLAHSLIRTKSFPEDLMLV